MTQPKAYAALPFLADPAREAEDLRLQELRRGSHGRGRLTREERDASRGLALEEAARANLGISMDGRRARRGMGGMVKHDKQRLAEAYALTGRFRAAQYATPDPALRRHYKRCADAVARDDAERCNCPDVEMEVGGQRVSVTPRNVEREVYSEKHGRVVPLVVCQTCGHANARPLNGRLVGREAAMRQAGALAREGARGVSDAQALRQR